MEVTETKMSAFYMVLMVIGGIVLMFVGNAHFSFYDSVNVSSALALLSICTGIGLVFGSPLVLLN